MAKRLTTASYYFFFIRFFKKMSEIDIKIKKLVSELMDGIVFLPLYSGNMERIERVKRIWRGKKLYSDPKIF